jgi:hypothetical protein
LTSITDFFAIIKLFSDLFDLVFMHIMDYRQEDVFLKKKSLVFVFACYVSLQTRHYVPNISNLNLAWVRFTIVQCKFHNLICPAFICGHTV